MATPEKKTPAKKTAAKAPVVAPVVSEVPSVGLKDRVLQWLAVHPIGTAVKVGVGAGLAWVLNNIASLNLNPTETAAVIMVVNIAINALNPQDTRYGVGSN
jgi:hypothetical protein